METGEAGVSHPYADAALAYWRADYRGVLVLPPKRKEWPEKGYTGWGGRFPSMADVTGWTLDRPDGNIALRLPEGLLGLDVDAYDDKPGAETLAALEKRLGPLPATVSSTSRGYGPSRIRLYRVPAGRGWRDDLEGIEPIHYGHRYMVVWPSVHPDTGEVYRWYGPDGAELDRIPSPDEAAELPAAWVDELSHGEGGGTHKADADAGELRVWLKGLRDGPACEPVTERLDQYRRANGSRHNAARGACASLIGFGAHGHRGVAEAVTEVRNTFYRQATEAGKDQRSPNKAKSEWARMLSGAIRMQLDDHPEPGDTCACEAGTVTLGKPRAAVDLDGCVIPADVWEARPELAHIRRAAHNRGRSADAVLAATLARVVADTPHTVRIPPIVGAPAGLTLIAAIAGPPGTGKSSGAGIAAELWPARLIDRACDGVPPGSGEGFIELLFEWVAEPDPATGKKIRVHRQTRHNAYMFVDEGDVLAKLAARQSGSTLLSHIRTAFTGGTLGQSNASQDRKRIVPAGQYVYGVVLGIQPALAGPLFDEAGAGTPQRILWASATAPTPPPGDRPDWPGPLERPSIDPPDWARHEARGAFTRHDLAIPESVARQIEERDHHRQRHGAAALEEHRDLIQLKVGAALAILDGRLDLTTEDWQLAALIVDTSSRVRDRLADHLRQLTADREAATADRLARRQVEATARTAEWFMVDTARKIAAKVRAEPGEHTPGRLRGTFTPQRREVFDDALDHAKAEGWIEERDDDGQGTDKKRLYPGDAKP